MRKVIYCPVCMERGKKKRLLEADESASGTLYCWCKGCKKEVIVEI